MIKETLITFNFCYKTDHILCVILRPERVVVENQIVSNKLNVNKQHKSLDNLQLKNSIKDTFLFSNAYFGSHLLIRSP